MFMHKQKTKKIIGLTEYVSVANIKKIPAKIDTGADSSSIWVSNITIDKDHKLSFTLLSPEHKKYTGEKITVEDYRAINVRSSNGQEEIRYRTTLPIKIAGKQLNTQFSLSNRKKNIFPILIGKKTLRNIFLVDPSISKIKIKSKHKKPNDLLEIFKENPYDFHQKYIKHRLTQEKTS